MSLLLTMMAFFASTQESDYNTTKEKIYIQTNHVFFKPGDQVFFKIYVVDAKTQTPSRQSMIVYAELINPSGNVIQKMNFKVENGYAEGSYDFTEGTVGGIYKIRAYTSWMQNESETRYYTKEITLQQVIAPRVLMKLDFPGRGYGAGDEVSADFSMRSLSDEPIRHYEGGFTVSLGGDIVHSASFKTDQEGKAKVKFTLPRTLATNDGLLNITINYDAYTESISRSIPIVLNKIDLQLLPEGGSFVHGVPTQIAFKALNENGKAADVKGEVWDGKGNKVASFESYHFGMGKFNFTPFRGESYKVKITAPANITQEYGLPAVNESGVVMNVSKTNKKITIRLASTDKRSVRLTGLSRENPYYDKVISLQKGENTIDIDENLFPAGIAQFTVNTVHDVPLAERLIFLHEDKNLRVVLSTDKQKYLPREKVKMTIKTVDTDNNPVPSNFSLAVVDDKLWTMADDKQDHILSWLLMSSELNGKVEEPQFYFKKDESKSVPALDLVMLTHGYRYFDYIEFVQQEGKLKFLPEQGTMVAGVIVNSKDVPTKANLYLVETVADGYVRQVKTNDDGSFAFTELSPGSDYYLFAQALNRKDKVKINVLQNGFGYFSGQQSTKSTGAGGGFAVPVLVKRNGVKKEPAIQFRERDMPEDRVGFNGANQLQEVVVTGLGIRNKRELSYSIAKVSNAEFGAMHGPHTLLQGRVAGLNVVTQANQFASPQIVLRGVRSLSEANQPLVVLNGVPMEQFRMSTLNPNDIDHITILKDGNATALYGAKAAHGAIVIDSKKSRNENLKLKFSNAYSYASQLVRISGPSYTPVKRFYIPKYQTVKTKERDDFRETIYWNPVVQTGNNGMATVEFYNSDATTTFRAIAEGIGYNGNAGRGEMTYAAESALSVDAKIPPYLTIADKTLIPVAMKNNSGKEIKLTLELIAPDNIEGAGFIADITLLADSSRQVLVPLTAVKPGKGTLHIVVESAVVNETISLPIAVADKGFPVVETFSGNASQQYDFAISNMIPGTLKAELKLYKNLEGQLLDGIESMLQEPYGCFEQTSSVTYPNIYVLKYLRSAGKSNPDIEKQALGFIQNGYKRLIGYETSENGFEWFGRTPPHEALTAYGLLEFTDMQEFVSVDKQMLNRTKKFLLSRRDGKGGFHLNSYGLDQFAAVPAKIANIYIVYALTQAGIGAEIKFEYETAVKKALNSDDGYQLAMMALAASNMKNHADYTQLMQAAGKMYREKKMAAETSVVNSRGESLKVETISLYALALMRDSNPDIGVIAPIISKILSARTYYGYGATQATVLALQAIVEYSKLTNTATKESPVLFTVNQQRANEGQPVAASLKEGNNAFGVTYEKDAKAIPYHLQVSYNTYTPPNSDKAELLLTTTIRNTQPKVGETTRMEIEVNNVKQTLQPMAIAKIGIPAGLSVQPWQLKEIMEKHQVAYYEIFDNYLVFYWMGFRGGETKKIQLDLKAEIPGVYRAKASNTYLYYTPEYKHWNEGIEVNVKE